MLCRIVVLQLLFVFALLSPSLHCLTAAQPRIQIQGGCENGDACPTLGGNHLTIDVSEAGLGSSNWSVYLGRTVCPGAEGSEEVDCLVPEGIGGLHDVFLISDDAGMLPVEGWTTIRYAQPEVLGISSTSCPDRETDLELDSEEWPGSNGHSVAETLLACSRSGSHQPGTNGTLDSNSTSWLHVWGRNFGSSGATVFVGCRQCLHTVHDPVNPHRHLSCLLPPGWGRDLRIRVLQRYGRLSGKDLTDGILEAELGLQEEEDGGEASNTVSLSYTSCPSGTFLEIPPEHPSSVTEKGSQCSQPWMWNAEDPVWDEDMEWCTPCPPGTYSDLEDSPECYPCPPGTFQPTPGQEECLPCPSGRFSSSPGASSCQGCPVGRFSADVGARTCFECPQGTFGNVTGLDSCHVCPAGRAQSQTGRNTCPECPAGTQSNSPTGLGSTACTACPAGTFSETSGSNQCQRCGPGTVQPNPGQNECMLCEKGKFSDAFGALSCRDCPCGRATAQEGSTICSACPEGTFSGGSNQQSCQLCPPGSSAKPSLPPHLEDLQLPSGCTCHPCAPGTFMDDVGQLECQVCPKGTFSNHPGQTVCAACPKGRFSASEGSQDCQLCPRGRFQNSENAEFCETCPPGLHSPSPGAEECIPCPLGSIPVISTVDGDNGAWECMQCTPGRTSPPVDPEHPDDSVLECMLCPPGRFGEVQGSPSCFECPKDTISTTPGSLNCTTCPPGRWTRRETGASVCRACDGSPECLVAKGEDSSDSTNVWVFDPSALRGDLSQFAFTEKGGSNSIMSEDGNADEDGENLLEPLLYTCDRGACASGSCAADRALPVEENYLCAECADGYSRSGRKCSWCGLGGGLKVVSIVALPVILVFVGTIHNLTQSESAAAQLKILLFFLSSVRLLLWTDSGNAALESSKWLPLGLFGWFDFDFDSGFMQSCFANLSPLTIKGLLLLSPLAHIVVLWLLYLVSVNSDGRLEIGRIFHGLQEHRSSRKMYINSTMVLLLLSYTHSTRNSMEFLHCRKVGDRSLMSAEPSIDCDSETYRSWLPLVWLILILHTVLFPVVLFATAFLYKHQREEFTEVDAFSPANGEGDSTPRRAPRSRSGSHLLKASPNTSPGMTQHKRVISSGHQKTAMPTPSAVSADEPMETADDGDGFFHGDGIDSDPEESKSSRPNTPERPTSTFSPSLSGRRRSSNFGHRRFSSLSVVVDEEGQQWLLRWTGLWVFRASYRPGWIVPRIWEAVVLLQRLLLCVILIAYWSLSMSSQRRLFWLLLLMVYFGLHVLLRPYVQTSTAVENPQTPSHQSPRPVSPQKWSSRSPSPTGSPDIVGQRRRMSRFQRLFTFHDRGNNDGGNPSLSPRPSVSSPNSPSSPNPQKQLKQRRQSSMVIRSNSGSPVQLVRRRRSISLQTSHSKRNSRVGLQTQQNSRDYGNVPEEASEGSFMLYVNRDGYNALMSICLTCLLLIAALTLSPPRRPGVFEGQSTAESASFGPLDSAFSQESVAERAITAVVYIIICIPFFALLYLNRQPLVKAFDMSWEEEGGADIPGDEFIDGIQEDGGFTFANPLPSEEKQIHEEVEEKKAEPVDEKRQEEGEGEIQTILPPAAASVVMMEEGERDSPETPIQVMQQSQQTERLQDIQRNLIAAATNMPEGIESSSAGTDSTEMPSAASHRRNDGGEAGRGGDAVAVEMFDASHFQVVVQKFPVLIPEDDGEPYIPAPT